MNRVENFIERLNNFVVSLNDDDYKDKTEVRIQVKVSNSSRNDDYFDGKYVDGFMDYAKECLNSQQELNLTYWISVSYISSNDTKTSFDFSLLKDEEEMDRVLLWLSQNNFFVVCDFIYA